MKRGHIFGSNESAHRETNKVKILAALGLSRGRYSIFMVLLICVYRVVHNLLLGARVKLRYQVVYLMNFILN